MVRSLVVGLASAVVAAGCGSHRTPVVAPAHTSPPPVAAPPARRPDDPAPWPMAMRVYTWTPDGIAQVGELPWQPPPAGLATPWYIEPSGTVDAAALGAIVDQVRAQRIPGLSLRGQACAASLGLLRDLPALSALVLDDTDVTGDALAATDLALTRLYLSRTPIDDVGLVAMLAREPGLEVLAAADTAIGDASADAIAALARLAALDLGDTALTDAGGGKLGALAALEILELGHTRVGARTIAAVRGLPLRELFLAGTEVGKEVKTLAPLAPRLARLDVSNLARYKPTDADLGWLAGAAELVELGISGSRVTDALATALVALPHLERLRAAAVPITLATIELVAARGETAQTTDFVELDLAQTPVDDAHAARLLAGPRLQVLRLDDTAVTDAGLAGAAPVALAELYLSRTLVTDAGLAILDAVPHLSGLGLAQTRIGAPTLARIARLSELRTVVLDDVAAPREALAGLGGLHALETLTIEGTAADDATIAALAELRYLRILHLARTQVSDAALPALRGLALIGELTLGDTRLTAAVAEPVGWPRLRTLALVGLGVGDGALASLARRGALRELDLSATEVTDPAPLAALPRLAVLGLVGAHLSRKGRASAKALAARGVEIVR